MISPDRTYAAEELRAFALRFERAADVVHMSQDGRGQERRIAFLDCAKEARARADMIDPNDQF
jgi:phage anti-repressor protein